MIDAMVPSIDLLGECGHFRCPIREPTMLAAESPIPIESTPLSNMSLLTDFASGVIHKGRNIPIKRYIFVRTRLP